MRKLFILLKAFYQKIQLPAFFLFFIILIAEFLLVYLLGTYRFFTLTDRLFETVMRENALYVMRFTLSGFDGELFSELRAMPGVNRIYASRTLWGSGVTYGNEKIQLLLTDPELLRNYPLLNAESYFSETGMENGRPQGIAVGDFIAAGTREAQFGGSAEIPVRLIGTITSPYMIPAFTEAGNAVSSYDVIKAYDNTIILKDAPEVLKYFEERGFLATHSGLGFILVFQSDCTEEERQAVLNFLEEHDLSFTDADTIRTNSQEITSETLRKMMPLPLFLAALSASLTLCSSILFLHGNMELILPFYLSGCSKKNGSLLMCVSLGMVGALATLVNLILMTVWRQGVFSVPNFIIDYTAYVFLVCCWLLLLFLSVFAAFLIYRQKSCASIRRKVDI